MRELTRLIAFSEGEVKLNSLVPGLLPGVDDCGQMSRNFRETALICAAGIRLNGTWVVVPGNSNCWLGFAQVPAASKPAVHSADRSPARNAAFGTTMPVTGLLLSMRNP